MLTHQWEFLSAGGVCLQTSILMWNERPCLLLKGRLGFSGAGGVINLSLSPFPRQEEGARHLSLDPGFAVLCFVIWGKRLFLSIFVLTCSTLTVRVILKVELAHTRGVSSIQ